MQKIIFTLLIFLLLIGMLAGCTETQAIESETKKPVEAETLEASSVEELGEGENGPYVRVLDPDLQVVSMSASLHTVLAIMEDDSLWMWDARYRLDERTNEWILPDWSEPPRWIMDNAVYAVAGLGHCLAIDADGTLWSWGEGGERNMIGDGSDAPRPYPVPILENVVYATISPVAPNSHVSDGVRSYAITAEATLYGWGQNGQLEWPVALGDGTDIPRATPVVIMENVASVTPTREGAYAETTDGIIWWWGERWGWAEDAFEEGNNPNDSFWQETRLAPVRVDSLDYVPFVQHSPPALEYEIDENNTLWTWGENQLPYSWNYMPLVGDGTNEQRMEPVRVMDDVKSVVVLADTVFVIDFEHTLWAWGVNHLGQIGDGTTQLRLSPVTIMENVTEISAHYMMDHGGVGFMNTFVMTEDGVLWRIGSLRGHGTPYPLEYRGESGVLPLRLH